MKTKLPLLTLTLVAICSCAAPTPTWSNFNPLDKPGEPEADARSMHEANIRKITSNPAFSFAP